MLLNAIFIGLTIVKAFYIIGEFMHLRHEVRNLILTFLIPLILLVWAIIAFMWDGSSWQAMRDTSVT
jgi:cytochrome c oxidase subunit IV